MSAHIFFYENFLKNAAPRENLNLWIVVHEIGQEGQPQGTPIFQGYAQKFLYDNEWDADLHRTMHPLLTEKTRSVVFATFVGSQYLITRP